MNYKYSKFESRKIEHIKLALMKKNQTKTFNILDTIHLMHEALPDINFCDINISNKRFGKKINKPFVISPITAGNIYSYNINFNLFKACEKSQWSMSVGSQRRELTDKHASHEWKILKNKFPNVNLFSNLGITQLIDTPLNKIQNLIDNLQAEAIIIHCNPLQEILQPEGIAKFKGCWKAIEILVKKINVPVIIKETGCGFSKPTLKRLNEIGISAVDVSGMGGTHWGRIEGHRSKYGSIKNQASITFRNWGISTVQSIRNAISLFPNFEIWGSGGIRNGLDAAKLFALGVSNVGFAKIILEKAIKSYKKVYDIMNLIEYELKIAMFCTGSRLISELKEKILE